MNKHFTATAYIVAKIDGEYKVLLHRHKKHKFWLGIGGHLEKGENPVECLMREVYEETNLEISLIKTKNHLLQIEDVTELASPVAILEEKLAPYKNEPAHYHVDLIYFAVCKKPEKIKMAEQFAWFSREDLKKVDLEKEVKYLTSELFNYVSN